MSNPQIHDQNKIEYMNVQPSELRTVESALSNFDDDLERVLAGEDGERTVYHDGENYVAVLIDAASYESLCDSQ